jgi:hypothetical protein
MENFTKLFGMIKINYYIKKFYFLIVTLSHLISIFNILALILTKNLVQNNFYSEEKID